jgi:hypothetical protein
VAFLVEDSRQEYPGSHAYVRMGEGVSFLPVMPNDFTLIWYSGSDWREIQWEEQGKILGAFGQVPLPALREDSLKKRTYLSFRLRAEDREFSIEARGDSLFELPQP